MKSRERRLEVIGERACLWLRKLWMASRQFGEIVRGTGARRDRIAARLKVLYKAGVVARVEEARPRFDYHLTESGKAQNPVLKSLLAWGRDYAVPDDPDLHLSDSRHADQGKR